MRLGASYHESSRLASQDAQRPRGDEVSSIRLVAMNNNANCGDRVNLESWLPQELHNHINIMLVGLGQTICLPINPKCDLCHLGQLEDSPCPSKRKALVKQAQVKTEEAEMPLGELGPVAETVRELEDMRGKPIVAIKLETVELDPALPQGRDLQLSSSQTKISPYFPTMSS